MEPPKLAQNTGVLYIFTCTCAWRHSGVPFFDNFSTSALQKVARECQFFSILTCKCASRYSGVQFFHIATSKSGPRPSVFYDFDLKMCFSPQRRAIFPHRNFKKWPEHVARGAFFLKMCFSPQRRAIFQHRNFKKWPEHVARGAFFLKMCFSPQRRAIFHVFSQQPPPHPPL